MLVRRRAANGQRPMAFGRLQFVGTNKKSPASWPAKRIGA